MEIVGAIAVGLTRLFGRVESDGLENLPLTGPAIVVVNHTTIADVPPVLSTLHRAGLRPSIPCHDDACGSEHGHVRFLAASQVFNHPLIGPLARHAGMVEVGLRQASTAALRAARDALGRGEIIGIYPEGDVSATTDGSPRRFRFGVGRLALDTQVPVIPVAHHDARAIGSGSTARSLGGALTSIVRRPTVRLRVGKPISPDEFAGMAIRDVVDLVQTRVTDVWRSLAGADTLEKGGP
ncbi:lysophospholipid acyltransferase family protein [Phytoactinopolyspora endophytica]|uniref:lysophospholipid acyltransferase family protein n=1 Tax=Phytoactinopolyspora endophytica TaxID=1642495 RepID=UPI0013ECEAD1|nr:lysophospholipid acyltransferase family protein [Phytoactinopolyspora endophytica]